MNESKITVRYAKALFSLAREGKAFEGLKNDMQVLHQCIREVPELNMMLKSPVIKVSEKIKLFEDTFGSTFLPVTLSFLKIVLERRREEYLEGISRYFLSLLQSEEGIQQAELVTAIPLNETLRKTILNFIHKRFSAKVELNELVDEKLIGGFILRVGDQQIDASISNKLERIKNSLINSHS
ncbi:MAG TPA: ATP synthase F1 subunit delta [Bacteroidales bacterium]|jgi:F-type H+-transporting ATPase subunit delta|nr:ATP synthase F1 subunit delta [Bacteroidales bacterium]